MQPGLTLRELDANQFLAKLEACVAVYAAAMNPPPEQLAGRYTIMERHAGYGTFRAVAALAPPTDCGPTDWGPGDGGPTDCGPADGGPTDCGPADGGPTDCGPADGGPTDCGPADGAPTDWGPADGGPADGAPVDGGLSARRPASRLAGFTYGFHGAVGQWWHDLVSRTAAIMLGASAADDWFGDSLEIAEVHVLPRYQGRGTGLAMLLRLTDGRPERAAVLSTMDADTRARRLYHGLGFTDLLTGFAFPGTDLPYAIMGAPLPLPGAPPSPARPDNPSRW